MSMTLHTPLSRSLILVPWLLAACSASDETRLRIEADPGDPATAFTLNMVPLPGPGFPRAARTSSNLVSHVSFEDGRRHSACYLVHVTAPDLVDKRTLSDGRSCQEGVPGVMGVGKLFGPFAYGSEAVVRVASGPQRRVGLIGFVNPHADDPDCSKHAFSRDVADDGALTLRYGAFVLNPKGATSPLETPPQPLGRLGFFQHSETINLAPGAQSVRLKRLEWVSENGVSQPAPYGGAACDDEGLPASPYVHVVSPFAWGYQDGQEPQCGTVPDPALQGQKFRCVRSSVLQGPVTLSCPAGATAIRVEQSQSYSALGENPAQTTVLDCEASGVATFMGFSLSGRSLEHYMGAVSSLDYLRFTPLQNGIAQTERAWIAVASSVSAYRPMLRWRETNGSYLPWETGGFALARLAAYHDAGSDRFVYLQTTDSRQMRVKIQDPSVSDFNSSLPFAGADEEPLLLPELDAPTGLLTLVKALGSPTEFFPALLGLSVANLNPFLFNTTRAGLDLSSEEGAEPCLLNTWCRLGTPSGSNPPSHATLASQNGFIVAGASQADYEPSPLLVRVGHSTSYGHYRWSEAIPVSPQNSLTLTKIKVHAPTQNALILTLSKTNLSTPHKQLSVLGCPQGLATCETDSTLEDALSLKALDAELVTFGPEQAAVWVEESDSTYTFHRKSLGSQSPPLTLNLLSSAFHPQASDATLFPAGASILGVDFLRALHNPDQNITGTRLVMSVRVDANAIQRSLVYESLNGGLTWYLTQVSPSQNPFLDALAVENRWSWQGQKNDRPAFILMDQNTLYTNDKPDGL